MSTQRSKDLAKKKADGMTRRARREGTKNAYRNRSKPKR